MKCWADTYRISRTTLLSNLIQFTKRLGRTPTRREYYQSTTCAKEFGSWTKCLIAAGLTPHRSLNQKMYRRRICEAKDGHICNSVSELIIDNWLFGNKIKHEKEVLYPIGKHTADWKIDQKTYVEYFGLAHDSKRYDQEIEKKRLICREYGIELIEIYSRDLFPRRRLNEIFNIENKP